MTKTYEITVLDAVGNVIFRANGREGAVKGGLRELQGYRDACKRASGHLFTFDRTRKDCILVDGVAGAIVRHDFGDWESVVARLDRRGPKAVAERNAAVAAEMDAQRGQSTATEA